MILEVTLDTRELTTQQSLILVSTLTGQRSTVESPSNRWLRGQEIVLERWCIDLIPPPKPGAPDLPVVYKKSVVLFRRMFAQAKLLPVWRLRKRLSKVKLNNSLKLRVRVATGELSNGSGRVNIGVPLIEGQHRDNILGEYTFGQIDTPAGYAHLRTH
jgi:autophagy-related protein 13